MHNHHCHSRHQYIHCNPLHHHWCCHHHQATINGIIVVIVIVIIIIIVIISFTRLPLKIFNHHHHFSTTFYTLYLITSPSLPSPTHHHCHLHHHLTNSTLACNYTSISNVHIQIIETHKQSYPIPNNHTHVHYNHKKQVHFKIII